MNVQSFGRDNEASEKHEQQQNQQQSEQLSRLQQCDYLAEQHQAETLTCRPMTTSPSSKRSSGKELYVTNSFDSEPVVCNKDGFYVTDANFVMHDMATINSNNRTSIDVVAFNKANML